MPIRIVLSLLVMSLLCVGTFAQQEVSPAAVSLDGKQYIGFVKIGEKGPDPSGDILFPIFLTLVHEGDNIYGSIVRPRFLLEDGPQAAAAVLGFDCPQVFGGVLKGKKLTITILDEGSEQSIECKLRKNGEIIKFYMPTNGKDYAVALNRCNSDGTYLSGIYIGTLMLPQSRPAQYIDNFMLGVYVSGNKIIVGTLFADVESDDIGSGLHEGTYNPATGEFTILGTKEEDTDMTGTIAGGEIDLTLTMPADVGSYPTQAQISTTLYFFGDKTHKKLKATSVRPRKVQSGSEKTVSLKHKFALPGCVVRLVSAEGVPPSAAAASIKKFEYASKYLKVTLNPPAGSSGRYKMKITNPDGKEATSTKTFTIY
jgi:hypothetical protein